ncbi:MAG: pyrimidine 5'-nucleotidase [Mariprofundales bacterium]|nr:pyrimidine 5'-nucleotidase [Mariprofundales bacterium]
MVFDLDNTLYQAESGMFDQMDYNINQFVSQRLGISWREANILRVRYWRDYGTTLTGLMRHHAVDPEPFLHAAHNFEIDNLININSALNKLIQAIPARCIIHTNGTVEHAERVLDRLGIRHHFHTIYDIRFNHYQSKPCSNTLALLLAAESATPSDTLVIDDMADNLRAAANIGCRTALIGATNPSPAFDYCAQEIRELLRQLLQEFTDSTDQSPKFH